MLIVAQIVSAGYSINGDKYKQQNRGAVETDFFRIDQRRRTAKQEKKKGGEREEKDRKNNKIMYSVITLSLITVNRCYFYVLMISLIYVFLYFFFFC